MAKAKESRKAVDEPEEGGNSLQPIEKLQERYEKLRDQKVEAETKLSAAEDALKELKTEAKEQYGTDDVDKLAEILEEMKEKNNEKRSNYQSALDKIESELKEVESKFDTDEEYDGEEDDL